jgi:hypothetical protein
MTSKIEQWKMDRNVAISKRSYFPFLNCSIALEFLSVPDRTKIPARRPAAHKSDCLPLLPSGPDGVHKLPSHRAWPEEKPFTIYHLLNLSVNR